MGPINEKYLGLPDLSARELFTLVPLAVIVLILGVYPHAVLDLINTSLVHLNQVVLAAPAPQWRCVSRLSMQLGNVASLAYFGPELVLSGSVVVLILLDLVIKNRAAAGDCTADRVDSDVLFADCRTQPQYLALQWRDRLSTPLPSSSAC